MKRASLFLVLASFFIILSCDPGYNGGFRRAEVTEEQALSALTYAAGALGRPYEWGGNGPDSFDCSGLIVWAYRLALGEEDIFFDGASKVSDITAQDLYDYNVNPVDPAGTLPGDLIFITDREDAVTHVGMVESIAGTEVTFINASSYHGAVVRDTWEIEDEIRGQRIEG
ncbi:MAG: C40 family peptidase, partial [Spirochaetales bacterium]|nr:C40 family peptidase [Spirochaetales bacterium]